jgi:hypothetical protein
VIFKKIYLISQITKINPKILKDFTHLNGDNRETSWIKVETSKSMRTAPRPQVTRLWLSNPRPPLMFSLKKNNVQITLKLKQSCKATNLSLILFCFSFFTYEIILEYWNRVRIVFNL